ncbi:MAG: response regulator [Armatimonadetes bacterium]|nr:response regulator [Armatimonadota bacterium]
MSEMVGIGLVAGRGRRSRPITLQAKGYLRSKAAMPFLGRTIIEAVFSILCDQGIDDYLLVVKGRENREQVKSLIGYGEAMRIRVRYSPTDLDAHNTGSAAATLSNLERFDIRGPAFIFPCDSVLDIDLEAMLAFHRQREAVATVAACPSPLLALAGRYGLIDADPEGKIRRFVEKPTVEQAAETLGLPPGADMRHQAGMISSGFYLLDSARIREAARHPRLEEMQARRLDFGKDFLPWLVAEGLGVYAYGIPKYGDLGNISAYLETVIDTLHGGFRSLEAALGDPVPGLDRVRIAPETLFAQDASGRTLVQRIAEGVVSIPGPARIGRYVRIGDGAILSECEIGDECEIGHFATLRRSCLGDSTRIGPYAVVLDSFTGMMCEVRSQRYKPTVLKNGTALGDEVVVHEGVFMSGNTVNPRIEITAKTEVFPGQEVVSKYDALSPNRQHLARRVTFMTGHKVLVVDDEEDLVELTCFHLKGEGLEAVGAFDGEDALEKIEAEKPDLVLLDIMMPGMPGWDVCRSIKTNPQTRHIPVFFLTCKGEEEDVVKMHRLDADGYFIKPFDLGSLAVQVRDYLGSRSGR